MTFIGMTTCLKLLKGNPSEKNGGLYVSRQSKQEVKRIEREMPQSTFIGLAI